MPASEGFKTEVMATTFAEYLTETPQDVTYKRLVELGWTPPGQPAQARGEWVLVPKSLLKDWQFRTWKISRDGHNCEARVMCDAISQSIKARLAAAPTPPEAGKSWADGEAWCSECCAQLELVRPGKYQHPTCSQHPTTAANVPVGVDDLIERLMATLRDLGENRLTHVVWRDWLLQAPENATVNPHAGDAAFHDSTIKEYDRHLATIDEAIRRLAAGNVGVVDESSKHSEEVGDGLRYVLCQVGFGDHYRDWLLIPHADGQYVTAAKLSPFSMSILRHALRNPGATNER